MFDKALFLFLLFSPLCYQSRQDLSVYADRFLILGTILLACFCLLFCKPKRIVLPKWPAWLLIFSIYKLYSLPYHALSLHAVFSIFFGIIIFYLVVCFSEDIRWLYRAAGLVVIINSLYVTGQFFGYSPVFNSSSLSGFFAGSPDLAGYLILAMPLCAHFAKGGGLFLPLILMAGFLHSYTAIACGFMASAFVTVRKGLYPLLFILAAGICVISFMKEGSSVKYKITQRMLHWKPVVEASIALPVAGNGLGRAIDVTAYARQGYGWFNVKNDYLEFGYEVGTPWALGFIVYVLRELILRYKRAVKRWDLQLVSISLLSFLLALTLQSHLRNPKIAPLVMAVLGWFYILTDQTKKEVGQCG